MGNLLLGESKGRVSAQIAETLSHGFTLSNGLSVSVKAYVDHHLAARLFDSLHLASCRSLLSTLRPCPETVRQRKTDYWPYVACERQRFLTHC